MNRETRLKIIKIILSLVVVVAIIFVLGMMVLTYQVEGEGNLPFKLTKIIVVSSSEGIEKENKESIWALDINQNNDIYIYVEKNESYGRTEIIDKIKLNNFQIQKVSSVGEVNIYKPTEEGTAMFINNESNKTREITYSGALESNIKKSQISNQGGLVVFRCANDKIGEHVTNEGNEVNYNSLLKETGISNQDLDINIAFDITIELISKKAFKAQVELELPVGDIINNQTANLEITDLSNIVFKRVEN